MGYETPLRDISAEEAKRADRCHFCENHEERRKRGRKQIQGRKRPSPFSPLKSSLFLLFSRFLRTAMAEPLLLIFRKGILAVQPWRFLGELAWSLERTDPTSLWSVTE